MARQFPHLLDVAGLGFRALVDAEGISVLRRPAPGDRIEEPVGRAQVVPGDTQHFPVPVEKLVRGRDQRVARRRRDLPLG